MAKAIRDAYGEALLHYGKADSRVVALDADVSGSTKSSLFGAACPDRFFNCGIAESAMMGMAAGFASNGKIPFVNAFAVFLSTIGAVAARTYLSYSGLNVKLMGAYGGLSAGYDGSTHHALEDLAVMRALPGLTVMVASDAVITDWMVKTAIDTDGPLYIRLSREAAPDCHEHPDFTLGKGCVVRRGIDLTIIACGILVSKALQAADLLAEKGIQARVVDMFCIKPLDVELIARCARETGGIVTAEEHSRIGGLGSAVVEALAQSDLYVPVEMVGMPDCHAESGPYPALLEKYGLSAEGIAAAAEKTLTKKTKESVCHA